MPPIKTNCLFNIFSIPDGKFFEIERKKNIFFKPINNKEFKKWLIKENIIGTLYLKKINYKLIKHPKYSINRWLHNTRERLIQNLKRKMLPLKRGGI